MDKISDRYVMELTFDLPIQYKTLDIYPVQMKDYTKLQFFSQSILLEKNSIPDVEIITMTYLEFMYKQTTKERPYAFLFRDLLALCLRVDIKEIVIKFEEETNKPIFVVSGERYDSNDFEEIKLIIAEQNLIEIPDETIQKEIRDKIEEARKLQEKMSGRAKMGSLEDLVISIIISTSLRIEDIYGMTVRKFTKVLQRLDHKMHYEIFTSASLSGMVKFKEKDFIRHWLADLSKDKIEGVVNYDAVKSHINFDDLKQI